MHEELSVGADMGSEVCRLGQHVPWFVWADARGMSAGAAAGMTQQHKMGAVAMAAVSRMVSAFLSMSRTPDAHSINDQAGGKVQICLKKPALSAWVHRETTPTGFEPVLPG